jgi:hypothetical protein
LYIVPITLSSQCDNLLEWKIKDTYAALSPKGLVIFTLAFLFYKVALSIVPLTLSFGVGRLSPFGSMQELVFGFIAHTMTDWLAA